MKLKNNDSVCKIKNSLIQHGKYNDRIYLMDISEKDYPEIVGDISRMAEENNYSKSFAKVPEYLKDEFIAGGHIIEGVIPGMYRGEADGYFLSRFHEEKRSIPGAGIITEKKLEKIKTRGNLCKTQIPADSYSIREMEYADCPKLADLFSGVFESYPFPIDDQNYLKETMDCGTVYFGIWKKDMLAAAASSETDKKSLSVEMTDFATDINFRGCGLAGMLLDTMEKSMRNRGFKTAYTIARAAFLPVNLLFYSHDYKYAGTLVNNTNICGSFESMNLWYKQI